MCCSKGVMLSGRGPRRYLANYSAGRVPYEEETDRRQMSRGTYDAAELYVELADIAPTIWRRVRVPTKASLSQLHDILQCVFQWEDSHLHAFYVGEQEYRHPDQIYDDFGAERPKNEKGVKLTDIVEAGAISASSTNVKRHLRRC